MTLTRRIGIVVSLLLLLLLGCVLGLYFFKTKSYFEADLARDAERAAFSLAETLSPVLGDKKRVEEIINQAFEQGDFKSVELIDIKENIPVVKKYRSHAHEPVPSWFKEMIPIRHPVSERLVEAKNDRYARIRVVADRTQAYRELYELFLYTAGLFLFFGLIGLFLINTTIRMALKSLEDIRKQAEGINHNRFIVQNDIPSTAELKNVVLAMNSMVRRVKELYNRSSAAMRESQEMLYHDHATELYNRRYFQLKLPEYLMANDTRSRGVLILIRINGIIEGNRRIGRQKMDELLLKFARLLKQETELIHEPLIARINGTEFALIVPVYNLETARELANTIISKFMILSDTYGLKETLYLSIGICDYERKMQPGRLLSCADTALSDAAMYHENHVVTRETEDGKRLNMGKTEWRRILTRALKEGRLKPRLLSVHDLKLRKDIIHLVTFDIYNDDIVIKYGDYVPAVVELGLEYEMMHYEFDFMKQHRFTQEGIAFELIADMLQESEKLFFFEDTIKEIRENLRGPLFVEISEHDILALEPIVVEHVSMALKQYDVRFGINRFGGERGDFNYLRYSAPAYVKMDERNFLDLDTASKNALLTMLASLDIFLIVVNVHAENIPELQASAIRYIMY
ncbi:diguanylate cyclase [Hydrogenimonas sp. SS33]|uniref:diguanylate cyclase domain-containing protein n=1 Tax=Hydrogenimonas leucolamina TaxID=2954236 RepID=UPI00336C130A